MLRVWWREQPFLPGRNNVLITLDHIQRTFWLGKQPLHALDDINLVIEPGEYISVMGPSGSGKSTLLNVLGLLDLPDAGGYYLNHQNTTAINDEARAYLRATAIGFVFQSYHLIERLNARENIELPMMLRGISPRERRERSEQVIKSLGLVERAHHLPSQLSGGQRQRVAIARAIVMRPRILLADEPTGNLDTHSGQDVIELLEQLNTDGITLLVVTHDIDIGSRASRRIRMVDGKIDRDISGS